MRITILGSGSYNSSLSIRALALGQQLSQAGHNVSLIVPSADKYNNFTAERNPKDEFITIVQPWQFSTRSTTLNLLPYLVSSTLALFRSHPDIIYIYKPTPITLVGLLGRLFNKPVVLDMDDLGSQVMRAEHQSAWYSMLVARSEWLAIQMSSAIVVTSTYLQEYVKQLLPNKSILLLPNGVDPSKYSEPSNQAPRPFGYYFGFINRLSLVEPFLQSIPMIIRSVPTAKFMIIGAGSELEEAKALAKRLGIEHELTFTGWTAMHEVQRYTQLADIGICYQPDVPTVRAASNMKVFQYMAMGSVPVVSAVGDLPSYIQTGPAGVAIAANNPAMLASAVIALLEDPGKRMQMAKNGLQLAASTYSWQQLGRQLETFLVKVGRGKLQARRTAQ